MPAFLRSLWPALFFGRELSEGFEGKFWKAQGSRSFVLFFAPVCVIINIMGEYWKRNSITIYGRSNMNVRDNSDRE